MVNKFVRENVWAAGLLALLRIYVGLQWVEAGWHKLTGGFDASGFMKNAIAKPVLESGTKELVYPTYTAFIQNFALPNAKLFNTLIPFGELLVGIGLILGCLTTAAMFFGLLMNHMFIFSGTVSTNPWLILLGFIILVAGANAGRFGLDYYVLPFIRKLLKVRATKQQTNAA